ncbi:MAG TPA: hypothetical protein DEB40_12580 [Elusimicrobia bacterium]|nr:hypothetical protein [Elusimicrobiota bacterium]HBT62569.1 hypothetical protein [Elusimicrobiota bacterium]
MLGYGLLAALFYLFVCVATFVAGMKLFAHPAIAWAAGAACVLLAMPLLFRRRWIAGGALCAGAVSIGMFFPNIRGFESYVREGAMKGLLGLMRGQVNEAWAKTGGFPQNLTLQPDQAVRIPEHGFHREIEIADFNASVPNPPPGTYLLLSADAQDSEPFFQAPGGRLAYRILDAQSHELSSGAVRVSIPAGFRPDTGALTYAPKLGLVFINCTHKTRQREEPWWIY